MKTRTFRTAAIVSTLTLGALALSATAWAHGPQGGGRGHGAKFFEEVDVNQDGKIQKSEAEKVAETRFQAVDTNKDGVITRDEAEAKAVEMRAKHGDKSEDRASRMLERADKNKNGKIEKSESRLPEAKFDEIDTNKDGALTREELKAAGEKWRKDHPGHAKLFEKMDANKDGKVTREEAKAAHAARFAKMDKNGDGSVTKDEIRAGHPHMKRHGKDGAPAGKGNGAQHGQKKGQSAGIDHKVFRQRAMPGSVDTAPRTANADQEDRANGPALNTAQRSNEKGARVRGEGRKKTDWASVERPTTELAARMARRDTF